MKNLQKEKEEIEKKTTILEKRYTQTLVSMHEQIHAALKEKFDEQIYQKDLEIRKLTKELETKSKKLTTLEKQKEKCDEANKSLEEVKKKN